MIIFCQKDPQWKDIRLGQSNETIGSAGCLATALSTELYRFGFRADPKWIAIEGAKIGLFDHKGRLYFWKVKELTKGQFVLIDRDPSNKLCTLYEVHIKGLPPDWKHWLPGIPGVLKRVGDPIDGRSKSLTLTPKYEQTGRMAYLKRA